MVKYIVRSALIAFVTAFSLLHPLEMKAGELKWRLDLHLKDNVCSVFGEGDPTGSGYKNLGKYDTRKRACLDGQDRFDETNGDKSKCYDFSVGTRDECLQDGVFLPK